MESKSQQLKELLELLSFYRGMVLDACEQELGDSPRWEFLRSRLLKIFGNRGMEEKIVLIMSKSGGQK